MGLPETIALIVVLILAAMAMIVVEICTPMFGLLALLAVACVAWAVYLCYTINGVLGIAATVVVVLGVPAYAIAAVKIIPQTPLGRRLALKRDAAAPGEGTPEAGKLSQFVGRTTTAETILRPSGSAEFDGKLVEVVCDGDFIEAGAAVEVRRVDGNRIFVERSEG